MQEEKKAIKDKSLGYTAVGYNTKPHLPKKIFLKGIRTIKYNKMLIIINL